MAGDAGLRSPGRWVHLHLHRGLGAIYGLLAAFVLVVVLGGLVGYATSGRIVSAVVVAVVGLPLAGFLGMLALAVLLPSLRVSATRVVGRTDWGKPVDLGWDDLTIDVDVEDPPGRLRLHLGAHTLQLDPRSWTGFRDFVILVASEPAPARRLTPAARREVARLLQIQTPTPEGSETRD